MSIPLAELHRMYGEVMIQAEIIQGRVMEVKKLIAEEMQKPRKVDAKPIDGGMPSDAK